MIRTFIVCVLSLGMFTAAADAGLIVSLEARDVNGAALPSQVVAGTQAIVDVFLSVDGADDPLPDLRGLQFDFSGTSTSIAVDSFSWSVNGVAYSFQGTNPPTVSAITLLSVSSSILLTLTGTPVLVATVNVTINESGVFDVRNPNAPDINTAAWFRAGFETSKEFSLIGGNLSGGTINFTVAGTVDPGSGGGGGAADSDGDGVFDANDAFPSDPAETVDTNGNGVGDNADTDDDADGVLDTTDAFPLDPAEAADTDSDGVGDNADAFPADPTETTDSNGDGVGDNAGSNGGGTPNPPTPTPVRVCGLGMLGPSLLIFAGLRCVSIRRRRTRWNCLPK